MSIIKFRGLEFEISPERGEAIRRSLQMQIMASSFPIFVGAPIDAWVSDGEARSILSSMTGLT
jgi:hypothetical protein